MKLCLNAHLKLFSGFGQSESNVDSVLIVQQEKIAHAWSRNSCAPSGHPHFCSREDTQTRVCHKLGKWDPSTQVLRDLPFSSAITVKRVILTPTHLPSTNTVVLCRVNVPQFTKTVPVGVTYVCELVFSCSVDAVEVTSVQGL